ncbi:MAG: response regulator transcription factor [Anaerolineales bacterium]|nr:response regulator transcription factor [Anaerolineales bacterium]
MTASLARQALGQESLGVNWPLSERELEILRLMAQGCSNRKMAAALAISDGTVKNHVTKTAFSTMVSFTWTTGSTLTHRSRRCSISPAIETG